MLKDLMTKSTEELKLLVVQLRARQIENRFKAAQGEMEKTHLFKEVRKLLAQVLTILHQRNERMETKDWHKFNKVFLEQQAQAAKAAAEAEQAKVLSAKSKPKLKLKEKSTTSQPENNSQEQ